MSKYVVTGGCGFIGSNLVDKLLQEENEVIVLDNLSSGFLEYLPTHKNCKFIHIDLSQDFPSLVRFFNLNNEKFENVRGVFHLSAQSRIQPTILNPLLAHENNVVGTYNILELMRRFEIPKIVFSSSSSIYGLKNPCPQNENMPPDCLNPYSLSKFVGERYIETWCNLYGLQGASLRYFNCWGPREVIHLKDIAPIMGLFFRKLLKDKESLTIVGDGQQLRDHSHVSDIVNANILAMECTKNMQGEVFNIGTGKNYTVLELANMVLDSLGLDQSHLKFLPPRPAEARATKANNSKAKAWFGWEPKIELEKEILNHRDYYLEKWKK